MNKIPFNIPPYTDDEEAYVGQAIASHNICGDNSFTFKCEELMENRFHAKRVLLTTSGTTALEMACMLSDIGPGDEVILPSFTFSSTANAIVIFGGVPVFVDIREDTKNIDENLIEASITKKTKAIMVVHYAGVGCEMDTIMEIAHNHNLIVVEDAAQGVMNTLNNTVVAPPRMLISIMENNYQPDGSVIIPEVLRPYMGGKDKIIPNK